MEPNPTIKEEPIDSSFYEDKLDRARVILEREFSKEVNEREEQVVFIQNQIQEAQKTLEVLRYTASYKYYGVKEEVKEEKAAQSAIHPCVKKCLPDQMGQRVAPKVEVIDLGKDEDLNKRNNEEVPEVIEKPAVAPKCMVPKENVTIVRGTYRVKYQVIIGNISKSITDSHGEDSATHKWMMYLRMKEKSQDLSKIIKKVRYYLHDSYKPNDIIDVTTSPFHLTRRGWGEFPVRVTLYFHHPSNKPTDVIHELKLDYTLSGQQMLGGETVVDLNLFQDNIEELMESPKKITPKKPRSKLTEVIEAEHDYFGHVEEGEVQPTRPRYLESAAHMQPTGLTKKDAEMDLISQWDLADGPISEWYKRKLLERTDSICFLSTEACVKWLLNQWPIVTHNSYDENYHTVHPYTFPSRHDFFMANPGRRHAAEMYRAWKIRLVLDSMNLQQWTTKQIFWYARMYGYSEFFGKQYNIMPNPTPVDTFTNYVDTKSNLRQIEEKVEEFIDILGDETPKTKPQTPTKACRSVNLVSGYVKFVETTCREIGIRLQEEEVVEGVNVNASSVVLGRVLKLFLEDLLRNSLFNAWIRNKRKSPKAIEVVDIVKCIVEAPQLDILTNVGLGSKTS